jgi:hypothetical protein
MGDDFNGGGFAEWVDIGLGWYEVRTKELGLTGFCELAFKAGSREIKLLHGPVTLLNAVAED